jgi:hypothetical protein
MPSFDLDTWDDQSGANDGRWTFPHKPNRPPFQGERPYRRSPGLKPWPMISNRFAVGADR